MGHGDAQGVYRTCNAEIRWEHYPYGPPLTNKSILERNYTRMRFVLQNTYNYPRLDICYIKVLEELNIKYEIVDSPENILNYNKGTAKAVGCIVEINTLEQLDEFSNTVSRLVYNDLYDESLFPTDKYPNIKAIEIYDYYRE